MKPIYKVLIALGITAGVGFAFWYFSKPKDDSKLNSNPEPKPEPQKNNSEKKSESNNNMSSSSGEPAFAIEDNKQTIKVQNVYSVCSGTARKVVRDDKGAVSLGEPAYQYKANSKLGEFIKNVFINYNMPYVIIKNEKGQEILVSKTQTKIQQDSSN